MKNVLKHRLRGGERVFGTWITIGHPEITEILSLLKFDWFLLDSEHAPLTFDAVQSLLQTTSQSITPIVRVLANELPYFKQALDVGAQGVMVPMVESADEAEKAVKNSKYPPRGVRGTGARRATVYYRDTAEYLKTVNNEAMLIVQIETTKAVANFEEIVKTDGVDAWFIGPNDLAASLGHLGNPGAEVVKETFRSVAKLGEKLDVPGGILAFTPSQVKEYMEMGYRLLAVGSDVRFLMDGADSMLKACRTL
jgi:2-keto-3-deoxy-L-rhamnonate aldolase RhmA